MRIACPSCAAAYDVADSLLPAGRIVQCARCSKAWVPVEAPRVDEPEPERFPAEPPAELKPEPRPVRETDVDSPRLTALDRMARRAPPPRSSGGAALRAFWAVSIVVVLALLWGAYAWRGEVMTRWPQSVRAYSLLGLTAPQH